MNKRNLLRLAALALAGIVAAAAPAGAGDTIRIGAVAAKSGPLAAAAAEIYWPNVRLWAHEVNARGGLKLADGRARIELIEYDDGSRPGETIRAIRRLAMHDRADFVLAPYGGGVNLAAAATFARYGYPQITATTITSRGAELTKIYSGLFLTLGRPAAFVDGLMGVLAKFAGKGWIGKRVAMVNVDDSLGIELARIARPRLRKAGFEIVYDKSYGFGAGDMASLVEEAKAASPDAFIAWSYRAGSFGLTGAARRQKLGSRVFYAAFGTASPAFGARFGKAADAVFGAGGIARGAPATKAYLEAYRKFTGHAAEAWTGPVVYATCQILGQAIEGVGRADREAVTAYVKGNVFETAIGPVAYRDQVNETFWTLGQWQDGRYRGIASTGRSGGRPAHLKTGWE